MSSAVSIVLLVLGAIALVIFGAALAVFGLLVHSAQGRLSSLGKRLRAGLDRACGRVPWLDRDLTVLGPNHGHHQTAFVSRHALAEGGLECPLCQEPIRSGDFSRVSRTHIDGRENEVILCLGKRVIRGGEEVPCATILAASPDTEHGDHLDDQGQVETTGVSDPPDYYRFVRAPADQWLREKWGVESAPAGQTQDGADLVDVPDAPPVETDPAKRETEPLPAIKGLP